MAETNPPNPSKFYNHFLYKAIFVSIFLLLVPLFPSEAPNFINQTINTTSWELLQLVFVGIAVSYGLFSKRSNDEKEEVKSDNAHSYVTRLLQVSSVFDDDDDESESERQRQENSSKVETWSSQYYRGEPIVVVANETTDEAAATTAIEKPVVSVSESSSMMVSRSRSRGFSEENVVLRSPIPWRSRSGRMAPSQSQSQSQSPEDSSSSDINESLSFRYQSSTNPPPLPSEIQSKDVGRKNKSAIPPPPPPPPPPAHQKLNYYSRMNKEFTRSLTNEDLLKHNRGRRETSFTSSSGGGSKSFRIPRQTEYDEYLSHDREIESFIQRRGSHKKEELNTETESIEMIKDSEESQEDEEDDELVELASKNDNNVVDHGPDVDKKADEFIAKFREQIRLQRIASIRRSTSQTPKT